MGLQLTLPEDGPAAKKDDVSSPGPHTVGITAVFASKQATEVRVDIQVEVERELVGLDDQPTVPRLLEVAQDGFHRTTVGTLGIMSESTDLADGERDVGPRVGAQVQEHPADGSVAPCFVEGSSLLVCAHCGKSRGD